MIGSMGSQIEGVKQAVQQLIPVLAENPNLGIVIITFTEGGRCVCVARQQQQQQSAVDLF